MPAEHARIFASVRSADLTNLGAAAERLLAAGVDGLHVDLADGMFVPELGFGPAVARALAEHTGALVEAHLMVVDPERYLAPLADAGVRRVAVHLEAAPYPWRTCSIARSHGIEIGLAINPVTPVATLATCGAAPDFVNLLTTEPDLSGERLLPGMVERVAAVRAALPEHVRIEVDGGVEIGSAAALVDAGAGDLVVGRAITGVAEWGTAVASLRRDVAFESTRNR